MREEEDEVNGEESGFKKRRMRIEQVKELERSFEEQNCRLEPEMKVKLAKELGLQPRQIAIWFQNRRARWKTKKLEREFEQLSVDYEALKIHFQDLQQDREKLVAELSQLRKKVGEEKGNANSKGASTSFGEGKIMNFRDETDELSSVMLSNLGDLRDRSESDCTGNNNSPQRTITASDQYGPSLKLRYSGEGSDFALHIPPENYISGHELSRLEEEHGFASQDGTTLNMHGEERAPVFPWYWLESWT